MSEGRWLDLARSLAPRLPMPMAWTLVRFAKRSPSSSGVEAWKLFLDLFEVSNRTLAALAVGAYLEFDRASDDTNKNLLSLLNKRLSLGDWNRLFELSLGDDPSDAYRRQLAAAIGDDRSRRRLSHEAQSLIADRNQTLGHGVAESDSKYWALLNQYENLLTTVLQAQAGIAGFRLIAVTAVDHGRVERGIPLVGSSIDLLDRPMSFPAPHGVTEGDVVAAMGDPVVEAVWRVFPMQFFEEDVLDDKADVYLLEGLKLGGGVVERASYLGLPNRARRNITGRDAAAARISSALAALVPAISEAVTDTRRDETEFAHDLVDLQSATLDRLTKGIVGRQALVDDLIQRKTGEVLILTAPAGQGKSAVAAALAARFNRSAYFFFSRPAGHDSADTATQALVAQLDINRTTAGMDWPSKLTSWQALLYRAATEARQNDDTFAIVLDGVDECIDTPDTTASILPYPLPEGLFCVVTGRPGPHLDAFLAREDASVQHVPPLVAEDVAAILRSLGLHDDPLSVQRSWDWTHGNPLLLRIATRDASLLSRTVSDRPPSGLDSALASWMSQALGEDSPAAIMSLLTVSARGLDTSELRAASGLARSELHSALTRLRPYLLFENGRYQLLHDGLRRWLSSGAEHALDADDLQNAHRQLARSTISSADGLWAYSRDHRFRHLLALHEWDDVVEAARAIDIDNAAREVSRALELNDDEDIRNWLCGRIDQPDGAELLGRTANRLMDHCIYDERLLASVDAARGHVSETWLSVARVRRLHDQGRLSEALGALEGGGEAAPVVRSSSGDEASIYLSYLYAETQRELGRYADARRTYERVLSGLSQEKEPHRWLEVEHHIADLAFVEGDLTKASERLEGALPLAVAIGHPLRQGQILRISGHVHEVRNDREAATRAYRDAGACFAEANNPIHSAKICTNLAFALMLGRQDLVTGEDHRLPPDQASEVEHLLKLSLAENSRLGQRLEYGKAQIAYALWHAGTGDFSAGRSLASEALETLTDVGYVSGMVLALLCRARMTVRLPDRSGVHADLTRALRMLEDNDSYPVYRLSILATMFEAQVADASCTEARARIRYAEQVPATLAWYDRVSNGG